MNFKKVCEFINGVTEEKEDNTKCKVITEEKEDAPHLNQNILNRIHAKHLYELNKIYGDIR